MGFWFGISWKFSRCARWILCARGWQVQHARFVEFTREEVNCFSPHTFTLRPVHREQLDQWYLACKLELVRTKLLISKQPHRHVKHIQTLTYSFTSFEEMTHKKWNTFCFTYKVNIKYTHTLSVNLPHSPYLWQFPSTSRLPHERSSIFPLQTSEIHENVGCHQQESMLPYKLIIRTYIFLTPASVQREFCRQSPCSCERRCTKHARCLGHTLQTNTTGMTQLLRFLLTVPLPEGMKGRNGAFMCHVSQLWLVCFW